MAKAARKRSRIGWRRAALGGGALVVVLLVAAQVALPHLAENEVVDRLGGSKEVVSAHVHAVPAIKLLWHRADRVTARVRNFDAVGVDYAGDLSQTRDVGELDVRMARVQATRRLVLLDVSIVKQDGLLHGRGVVDGAQLAAVLPRPFALRLVPTDDGTVMLQGSLFGVGARAEVVADDGEIVVRPAGLLGAFAAITLFSDPEIEVERVSATPLSGGRFALSATARVR
ncbi:MAG TPA: hypothetical protein VGM91_20575 [Conexibacter sp.]|jgi:hypothetical protein